MSSKASYIQNLTNAPYYTIVCEWVCKNYNPDEITILYEKHPDYGGSLIDYYIDQAASIYVMMKNLRPNEISLSSRGIHFQQEQEYIYKPLSQLPLLGALWSIIVADTDRWEEDIVKARMVLKQMERISPRETDILRKEIRERTEYPAEREKIPQFIIDEVGLSMYPYHAEQYEQMFMSVPISNKSSIDWQQILIDYAVPDERCKGSYGAHNVRIAMYIKAMEEVHLLNIIERQIDRAPAFYQTLSKIFGYPVIQSSVEWQLNHFHENDRNRQIYETEILPLIKSLTRAA